MRLLVDTHILLWWQAGHERLSPAHRAIIEDQSNDLLVSVVSLWEIVMKIRIGKLKADLSAILTTIDVDRMGLLPIQSRHLVALVGLPSFHRDPFDHLLIAQAISEDAVLVTADPAISAYPCQILQG